MRRGFVDTPFGQMHYRELGAGPAVILLHQALRSSLEFRRVLPALADDYRVIAFDLIGFGDSAGAPRQLSIEDHAVSVEAAAAVLGLDRPVVGGHHTGAAIALEISVRRPEGVERVILSGPALTRDEAERDRARATLAAQPEPVPDAAGKHLQPIWREGLASAFGNLRIPPTELELLSEFFLEQMKAGPRRGEAHIAAFSYAIECRLPLLQCPALILSATEDMAACRRNADLLRLMPQDLPIMLREFDTAGEYPRLMPAEFALAIREFLCTPPAALNRRQPVKPGEAG